MGISFYSPARIPSDEERRRAAVRASNLLDPRLGSAIAMIVRSAARLAHAPLAAATIIIDDRQIVLASYRFEEFSSRRTTSICAHTILQAPEPMHVFDLAQDARFTGNPYVTDSPGLRSYFGTPLLSPDGHAMGALSLFDRVPRERVGPLVEVALKDMAGHIVALPHMPVFQILPPLGGDTTIV